VFDPTQYDRAGCLKKHFILVRIEPGVLRKPPIGVDLDRAPMVLRKV
jgi:hypothetical protein